MKEINTYIIEKLKIDKDVNVKIDGRQELIDKLLEKYGKFRITRGLKEDNPYISVIVVDKADILDILSHRLRSIATIVTYDMPFGNEYHYNLYIDDLAKKFDNDYNKIYDEICTSLSFLDETN